MILSTFIVLCNYLDCPIGSFIILFSILHCTEFSTILCTQIAFHKYMVN